MPASSPLYFFAYPAISSAKKQQRLPVMDDHLFDFGDENGVVPRIMGRLESAFQVCQSPMQNRGAMPGTVKAGPSLLFGTLVRAVGARIVFGNSSLVIAQHVDTETLFGVQVRM